MSGVGSLCDYCAKIPFDPEVLNRLETGKHMFSLGLGSRVERSLCPFCQLVNRGCYEGFRESPGKSSSTKVTVSWGEYAGPGKRGAFLGPGDAQICFAEPKTKGSTSKAVAREHYYVNHGTGPTIDIDQVKRWISRCERGHTEMCSIEIPEDILLAFPNLEVLRLVDVERRCIVEIHDAVPRYVALSYVWGHATNFRFTKANRTNLLTPGSLTNVWSGLPKTIQDAINVVQKLGARYLWVDSLCLMQNDDRDLDLGVNVMDLIYERAWLTVVACHGHDADAGLPGVRRGSRIASNHTIEVSPRMHYSRAWTFQEVILPRRVLYFTEMKVYFRCRMEEFVESCSDSHSVSPSSIPGANISSMLPGTILMEHPPSDYLIMLLYYTARALTNQSDALRALAGITRRFTASMKCRFLQGLPTAMFDCFILFQGTLLQRRAAFPSYSWAGWRGQVKFHMFPSMDLNEWLRDYTWIVWYKRSSSGVTNLVWDPMANETFPSHDLEYTGYRERHPFTYRRPFAKNLNTLRVLPTQEISFQRPVPMYSTLQFWTVSTFYMLKIVDVFMGIAHLFDKNQKECGKIWLDSFEETTFFEQGGAFEVILLSETSLFLDVSDTESANVHGRSDQYRGRRKYFNVMLLEWSGGIAERRGLGYIGQWAIDTSVHPGPVWKEIILA
ncbi:heterokaryon incompatibility protein-domain-containing protein [Xylariales sp. PMI_506]|nr:heterokaryon incompatibility protein-domain-containing protein [Xylariales sp. PMI_506]